MRMRYIHESDVALLRNLGLPGAGSALRASDGERERAADALRRHHADGRLTTDEFEQRMERALAARTLGDLDALFTDLPRLPAPDREKRPARLWLWPPGAAFPLVAAVVVVVMLSSAHIFWLAWPLVFVMFLKLRRLRRSYWRRSRGWPEPRLGRW